MAVRAALMLLRRKIITSSYDLVGLALFGVKPSFTDPDEVRVKA